MNRGRWLLGIAALLGLVLALVWVVPTAASAVDCGNFDPVACTQAASEVIVDARAQVGLPAALLPVTGVRLLGSPQCFGGYYVYFGWGLFAAVAMSLC